MVTIKPALWKVLLGIGAGLILIAFILGMNLEQMSTMKNRIEFFFCF